MRPLMIRGLPLERHRPEGALPQRSTCSSTQGWILRRLPGGEAGRVADSPEGGRTGTGLVPIGTDVIAIATHLGATGIAGGMTRGLEVTRASEERAGPIGPAGVETMRTKASGAADGTRLRILSSAPRSLSRSLATPVGPESRMTGYGLSMLNGLLARGGWGAVNRLFKHR